MALPVDAVERDDQFDSILLLGLFELCDDTAESMKRCAKPHEVRLAADLLSALSMSTVKNVIEARIKKTTGLCVECIIDNQNNLAIVSPTNSSVVTNPETKIPRPKNAFIIFRQEMHPIVTAQNPGMRNCEVSKVIGQMWRDSTQDVRDFYKDRAGQEARDHKLNHPQYHYSPRKSSQKKRRTAKSTLNMSFISESSTPSPHKYPSLTDLSDPTMPAVYHIEDNVPYHWGSMQDQMDMMLPMDQYYVRQAPAQPYAGNEQHRQMELETPSHLQIDRLVNELLPSTDFVWSDLSENFHLHLANKSS